MPDIPQITLFMDAIVLPLIGGVALAIAKFSQGQAARRAEHQFFVALVVMTVATLRTVIRCDEVWLVHMTTLAIMIVGALVIPNQDQSAPIRI